MVWARGGGGGVKEREGALIREEAGERMVNTTKVKAEYTMALLGFVLWVRWSD